MRKLLLILISILAIIMIVSFSMNEPEKPFVMLGGHKYYKCSERTDKSVDTIFHPGGFWIVKDKSTTIMYDHFGCDGVDD